MGAANFVTRWNCGTWPEWIAYLSQFADGLIAGSYALISTVLLVWLVRNRAHLNLTHRLISGLFGAFIMLCGLTHVCKISAWYWPQYYLFVGIDFACALASVPTAVLLLMPSVRELALPKRSSNVWSEVVDTLAHDARSKAERNAALEARCEQLQHEVTQGRAVEAVEALIQEMLSRTRIEPKL